MKFKPADVAPPDLDMTPMIDIVFQLITFFMVINKFDQAEADERVTLPRDQLAVPPAVQRKNSLLLNFGYVRNQTGQLLSPEPLFFFGDEQVTLEQVRPRLRQESQFYQTIGTDLADVVVEIRADAEVKSGMIQELIQMCQEEGVGFQRFALKATQKALE
jgi:biopolymer transport protein ExbD